MGIVCVRRCPSVRRLVQCQIRRTTDAVGGILRYPIRQGGIEAVGQTAITTGRRWQGERRDRLVLRPRLIRYRLRTKRQPEPESRIADLRIFNRYCELKCRRVVIRVRRRPSVRRLAQCRVRRTTDAVGGILRYPIRQGRMDAVGQIAITTDRRRQSERRDRPVLRPRLIRYRLRAKRRHSIHRDGERQFGLVAIRFRRRPCVRRLAQGHTRRTADPVIGGLGHAIRQSR